MSNEHIEELREWLQGRRPGWDIRPAVRALMNEAAGALEAKAAPVAYITGQFAGRCVIEAINRAAVLPTGMALYATPQPATVQGVNQQLLEALEHAVSEYEKLPHSLGYEFTHLPSMRAAIAAARKGEGE